MHISTRPKVVVLGMTSRSPFAGIVFLAVQYLVGLKRLGFDVYYVEAHGRVPWMLINSQDSNGSVAAAVAIAREWFDCHVVLGATLDVLDCRPASHTVSLS